MLTLEEKYVVTYNNNWVHIFDTKEEAIEEVKEVLGEDEIQYDDDESLPYGYDADGNQIFISAGDYFRNSDVA